MRPEPYYAVAGCRVCPKLRAQLEDIARERGWALSVVIREALTRYVNEPATANAEGGVQPPPADSRSRWLAAET